MCPTVNGGMRTASYRGKEEGALGQTYPQTHPHKRLFSPVFTKGVMVLLFFVLSKSSQILSVFNFEVMENTFLYFNMSKFAIMKPPLSTCTM